ncbi:tetratricopeptide repeat protein [Ekhidna sp.]|uniref:tetratricopeptide repeat protein n=1 Tax=Ekhidna sp. TaxID=2608089 RepID=UPI0032978466
MNNERIKLLEEYISEEPSNPFNKYALAMEFYESQPEKSLDILKLLLTEHPTYLPSYFKAAHLLWDNECWDDADSVFRKGIDLAAELEDKKALHELKSTYQNFQLERD